MQKAYALYQLSLSFSQISASLTTSPWHAFGGHQQISTTSSGMFSSVSTASLTGPPPD
jgi:hypothetical protein